MKAIAVGASKRIKLIGQKPGIGPNQQKFASTISQNPQAADLQAFRPFLPLHLIEIAFIAKPARIAAIDRKIGFKKSPISLHPSKNQSAQPLPWKLRVSRNSKLTKRKKRSAYAGSFRNCESSSSYSVYDKTSVMVSRRCEKVDTCPVM